MSLQGERAGEPPFEILLQVGKPVQVDPEEWECPLSLTPLYARLRPARGGSAFQALCLASALGLDLLHAFVEKGGVLRFPGGQDDGRNDFPFEAYAFGVAVRRSDDPSP